MYSFLTGWHRSLKISVGRAAMSFSVLLVFLLQEARMAALNSQLVSDAAISRHRRDMHMELDQRIREAWTYYGDHDCTCEDFFRQVGDVYAVL